MPRLETLISALNKVKINLCRSAPGISSIKSVDRISFQAPPPTKAGFRVSTTSLHTQMELDEAAVMTSEEGEDGQPPLQRRNSIHNVPFVDVNDPQTRERMERYKEERRSLLRAKFKVEDYKTKNPSLEGESKRLSPSRECQPLPSDVPKPKARRSVPSTPTTPPPTNNSFMGRHDDAQRERKWSTSSNRSMTGSNIPKPTSRRQSVEKPVVTSRSAEVDEEVNVRERAAIFGASSKVKEVKVTKTVSAGSKVEVRSEVKPEVRVPKSPVSPNKIKNMAAFFEQKN